MDSVQLNRLHIIETQYVKVKVIVEGNIPPNADAPARVSPHTNSHISYSILTPFMRKINVVKTTGRDLGLFWHIIKFNQAFFCNTTHPNFHLLQLSNNTALCNVSPFQLEHTLANNQLVETEIYFG